MQKQKQEPICYGQITTRNSCQETYETASRHAAIRGRQVRAAGFRAYSSALGLQVTGVGTVKLTMLTIMPKQDSYFDGLPPVRRERL